MIRIFSFTATVCVGVWGLATLFPGEVTAASLGTLSKILVARSQALGGSGTALGNDPTMIWLNPASSALLKTSSLTLAGQTGFFGGFTGQILGVMPALNGVLSIGGVLDDAGSVTLNAIDGTSRTVSARRDLMGILSYARALSPRMSGGFSLKGIQSELVEEFKATGFVFDFGFQMRLAETVKAGVAVKNFGTNLKFLDDQITSPTKIRVGLATLWRLGKGSPFERQTNNSLVTVVDAEFPVNGGQARWHGGLEYHWRRTLVFRVGGHAGDKSLGNLSAGLGFRIHKGHDGKSQRYRLDYSIRLLTNTFDPPQALSMTMAF